VSTADVMWKIRRVRLDRIGPSAARFLDVELDFRNGDGLPLDTILWLRNGGGKSTVLSLICALIRPGRRDFLATAATGKHLEDYVLGSDTAHVVIEWSGPQRTLVTGAVYEWADRTQPADPNRDHDRLNARWYVFTPVEGRAGLDRLPFRTDGAQTPLQDFAAAVRKWDAIPGCGAAVTKEPERWRRMLDDHGLDTAIFTPILQMNATEGGIEGQFQFRNADQFVQYLLELIVDPEVPAQVSQILEGVRSGLAERPGLLADMTFADEATPRLRSLAAAGEERARAADAVRAHEAGARQLAGRLEAAVALAERQQADRAEEAERLRTQAADHAEARTLAQRTAGRHRRAAAELRLAAARADGEQCTGEAARLGAHLAAWQATPAVHALREAERRVALLEEQLAAATEEAEPLRRRRDEAAAVYAAALEESLRVLDEQIGQQSADADLEREQEQAARKRGEEALAERTRLETQLSAGQAVLAALDKDLAAAVTAGHLRQGEAAPDGVARHQAADAEADALLDRLGRDRRELAAERTRVQAVIADLGEQRRAAEQDRDAAARRLGDLRERVAELAEDERLRVLGGGDEVDPVAEAGDLADAVSRAIARTDGHRIELAVDGAEDERALAALAATGLLPGSLDLVHAQDAVERAGITVTSGWRYLADSVAAEHRAGVLRAAPALASGLLVHDERDLAGAREALAAAGLRPTSAVVLATTAALGAVVDEVRAARGPAPEAPFLVPPAAALTDHAAAGDELTARERARADRSRTDADLAAQRDRDADLLRRLRELRADCPPGTLEELQEVAAAAASRVAELTERLAREDAALATRAEREADLEPARTAAERARRTAAAALGVLAGLVPRVQDAEVQREQVAELPAAIAACGRTYAAEVEAEDAHRRHAEAAHEHAAALARTATTQRADRAALGEVPAGALHEPLPVGEARAAWESSSLAYRREVSESALASSLQEAGHALARARGQVAELRAAVRADAAALLDGPDGLDAAGRSAATARAAAEHDQARAALSRAEAEIHLAQAELAEHPPLDGAEAASPEVTSREDALLAAAAADREAAGHGRRHEEAVAAAQAAADEQRAARERAGELRHLLDLLDVADPEPGAERFDGSVADARTAVEEARTALAAARTEEQRSRRALERLGQELALWAAADRFAGVKDAVRDRFRTGDVAQDVLPDAEQLAADLDLFAANLRQRIDELEEHKGVVVTAMVGMVRQALKSLSRAQSLSELPESLGEWAGQRFLEVGPRSVVETADAVVRDRCARLVDALTTRGGPVPRGHDLLWQATNAVVGEGNWKARVLKPSTTFAVERVSVERMRKWSGGEKVTISLLLFCMVAKLRATSRGRDRPGLGALPLDNPLGKANYVVFLNLQRKVAAANGIQLIFLTGVGDMKAVGRFPNVVRMRNTRSRNREYVSIEDRQVAAADPAGVVDTTRVWRADPTLTLL
jgi:hypothetical protein